jgi:uncharacterized protein YggE
MHNRGRVLVASSLVALALAASGCTRVVTTGDGAGANTVTASGTGQVSAVPDEAVMWFGVSERAKDAKSALDGASKKAEAISAELKKQGVAAEDIQTAGVNVYPQYDRNGNAVTGFEASVNYTATVTDIERLGEIITALGGAGAQNVSGPSFAISEDAPYRREAIAKAVDDARMQAEEMADAADKSVGEVVSITSSAVNVPFPLFSAKTALAEDSAGSVPVEPGTLDVSAALTVVFELK